MRAAGVRPPHARLIVLTGALIGAAAILWIARTYTFYFDEWDFILTAPDWTLPTYLHAHNEHPVILTRLIYAALLATVGLHSYLPYMASLLAFHAANVVLLFEIVRRRAGDLVAMGCAALLLLLGAGWEDLLWAFQISFVGAVTCGLGALFALELPKSRGRLGVAILLLAASIAFSAIGLFFTVAAVTRISLDRERIRGVAWFIPLAAAIVAWYVVFGRAGEPNASGMRLANLGALPAYVWFGLASSAGGLIGLEGWPAFIALALALASLGLLWWRSRPDALALGAAAGLLSFYAVTGLSRAQDGYTQSAAGRYVYIGAVFWLILLADAAKYLPWRGTWRPALAACLFLACFSSSVDLVAYAAAKTFQMNRAMADFKALAAERGDPCLNPSGAVDALVLPWIDSPALYYRAVDRYGDPSAGWPLVDHADYSIATRNLRRPGC